MQLILKLAAAVIAVGMLVLFVFILWAQKDLSKLGNVFNPEPFDQSTLNQYTPIFALARDTKFPPMLFAQKGDSLQHHPVILVLNKKQWQLFDLNTDTFKQMSWIHITRARGTAHVWALADIDVEGSGPTIEIVYSIDAGYSWQHLATINKPSHLAQFHSMRMNRDGSGDVVIYLDDATGEQETIGYYTYHTNNWGKSWSAPKFTPDILANPEFHFTDTILNSKALEEFLETNQE